MIQSIKQLYGDKLAATDGEIGTVKDFYFDDRRWAIRYLVADTGSWLTGRQVLISPHAVDHLYQPGQLVFVKLTRKQIEDGPAIETHQPVSRQYELRYFEYYGWPAYWQGDGLWGHSGFPMVSPPSPKPMSEQAVATGTQSDIAAAHLRSTQAVNGYHVKANDGLTGHVSDFMMEDKNWAIRHLVVKTGHRLSGKEVEIPTDKIIRISYEESTVFVDLTMAGIEQSPAHHPLPVGATVSPFAATPIL
jgi:sporulation protein YlmC with PRC-barrel domain